MNDVNVISEVEGQWPRPAVGQDVMLVIVFSIVVLLLFCCCYLASGQNMNDEFLFPSCCWCLSYDVGDRLFCCWCVVVVLCCCAVIDADARCAVFLYAQDIMIRS